MEHISVGETELLRYCIESFISFRKDGLILEQNDNAGQSSGFSELAGHYVTELFPRIFLREGEELVIGQDNQSDHETFIYHKDSTCSPVEYRLTILNQEDCYGMLAWIDVTEKYQAIRSGKSAMEEVKNTMERRNEFVANVTHELRTPVNGIRGVADNLLDTVLSPLQIDAVNMIKRCCDNMAKIINDLLDYSKMESGKLTLEQREFDLKKFIYETLAFNAVKIQEKGLKLVVSVGSDIPERVIGDELRLGQIINNLFSNATKFTSVGQITFEVVVTNVIEDKVELFFMVSDTGIGISKDESDKLFRSFSQVDGTITRRFGGTGLGLSICKNLVQMMNGAIRVESEKGKGSTFSFSVQLTLVKDSVETEDSSKYPTGRFIYHSQMNERESEQDTAEATNTMLAKLMEQAAKQTQETLTEEEPEDTRNTMLEEAIKLLEKVEISTDLGTWEKAEIFSAQLKKKLPEDAPELKRTALRLAMMIRKADTSKLSECIGELRKQLGEELENK